MQHFHINQTLTGNAMETEQATIIHKDYNTDLCPSAHKAR